MSAKASARGHGPLQIDMASGYETAQRGAVQCFVHHVGGKYPLFKGGDGEAYAVDRHTVPQLEIVKNTFGLHGQYRAFAPAPQTAHGSKLLD